MRFRKEAASRGFVVARKGVSTGEEGLGVKSDWADLDVENGPRESISDENDDEDEDDEEEEEGGGEEGEEDVAATRASRVSDRMA